MPSRCWRSWLERSPVTRCPGTLEACVLAGVHVQQIAGTGPLVAVGRLPHCSRRPRDPRPPEHLPDGRVAEAGRTDDQARPPSGLAPAGTDRLSELGRQLPRRLMRTAGAIAQANERRAGFLAGLQPTMPPAVRRRRRHAEAGRSPLQRHPLLDRLDQREPASQSELGVSVQIHPCPPLSVSPGRPTASKEGRTYLSAVHNVCRHVI